METYKHYDGTEEKIMTPAEELAEQAEQAVARVESISAGIGEPATDAAELNVRDAAIAALSGKEEADEYAMPEKKTAADSALHFAEEEAESVEETAGNTARSFRAIAAETEADAEAALGAAKELAETGKAKAAEVTESMDMTVVGAEAPAKAAEAAGTVRETLPENKEPVFEPAAAAAEEGKEAVQNAAEAAQPVPPVPEIPVREEDLLEVGSSVPPEEPPVTMPSRISRKTLTIGLICLAALLLAGGIFLMTKLIRHPLERAAASARDTIREANESELSVFAKNLLQHGSTTLKVDLNEMQDLVAALLPLPIKLDASAEMTLYSKYGSLAFTGEGTLKGKRLLDASLIYNEGKDIAVSSEIFFGKTNYGLNLKTLGKNLEGSLFDPAKGGTYAITPQEKFDQLKAHEFKEHALEELVNEFKTRLKGLTNAGLDYMIDNAAFNTGSQTVTIAGEDIKTNTLTMTFNDEVFCGLLNTLLDYCRDDKDMLSFLTKVADKILLLEPEPQPGTPEERVLEALRRAKNEIAEQRSRIAGTDFTVISYMNGGKTLRMDSKAVKGDQEAFCSFSFGPDVKAPKEIDLELSIPGQAVISAVYTVTSRTADLYSGKLNVRYDAADLANLTVNWDKKTGAFSVLVEALQENQFASLTGTLQRDGKITTLVPQKATYSMDSATAELPLGGVSLTFNEAAEFPTLPNFTEITSMSEEQFEAVFEDLQETLSSLFSLSTLFGQ